MTGTERAALRLALGLLRMNVLDGRKPSHAKEWRSLAELEARAFPGDFNSPIFVADEIRHAVPWRVLRARLCLYLRAVLRAERDYVEHADKHGDSWATWYGPADRHHEEPCSTCAGTGKVWEYDVPADCDWCGGVRFEAAPIPRPLWETGR